MRGLHPPMLLCLPKAMPKEAFQLFWSATTVPTNVRITITHLSSHSLLAGRLLCGALLCRQRLCMLPGGLRCLGLLLLPASRLRACTCLLR